MTVKALAPAKINLALHITGQRDDGYHLLESLVAFGPAYDVVKVTPAPSNSLTISGPEADNLDAADDNLILRAARLLDIGSARFELEKNLPVASGIGGGSTDAAAAIRGLLVAFDADHDLHGGTDASFAALAQKILALGADVPMCLLPRSARVSGIGEKITACDMPALGCILVNPRVQVSTPAVFKALSGKVNPPLPAQLPEFSDAGRFIDWLSDQRNDLQAPACHLVPQIDTVLQVLGAQAGCGLARMSGSGATCFGLFSDQERAKQAAASISMQHPEWWVAGGMINDGRDWTI